MLAIVAAVSHAATAVSDSAAHQRSCLESGCGVVVSLRIETNAPPSPMNDQHHTKVTSSSCT